MPPNRDQNTNYRNTAMQGYFDTINTPPKQHKAYREYLTRTGDLDKWGRTTKQGAQLVSALGIDEKRGQSLIAKAEKNLNDANATGKGVPKAVAELNAAYKKYGKQEGSSFSIDYPTDETDEKGNPTESIPPGYDAAETVERPAGQFANVLGQTVGALINRKRSDEEAPETAHVKRMAELADKAAQREERDAQRDYQISNRDFRVEGDKDAATRSAAMFNQKMAQTAGAAGGGAGAIGAMNTVDPSDRYDTYMNRADERFDRAATMQNQAELDRMNAEAFRMNQHGLNKDYQATLRQNRATDALSRGQGATAQASMPPPQEAVREIPAFQRPEDYTPAHARVDKALDGFTNYSDEDRAALTNAFATGNDADWTSHAARISAQNPNAMRIGDMYNPASTGLSFDKTHGYIIDPATGMPVDPGNVPKGYTFNPETGTYQAPDAPNGGKVVLSDGTTRVYEWNKDMGQYTWKDYPPVPNGKPKPNVQSPEAAAYGNYRDAVALMQRYPWLPSLIDSMSRGPGYSNRP